MPPFKPIKRKELVRFLRKAGFEGPYSGGKHQFMTKGDLVLFVPNPHEGDIGKGLLKRILNNSGISKNEWEEL